MSTSCLPDATPPVDLSFLTDCAALPSYRSKSLSAAGRLDNRETLKRHKGLPYESSEQLETPGWDAEVNVVSTSTRRALIKTAGCAADMSYRYPDMGSRKARSAAEAAALRLDADNADQDAGDTAMDWARSPAGEKPSAGALRAENQSFYSFSDAAMASRIPFGGGRLAGSASAVPSQRGGQYSSAGPVPFTGGGPRAARPLGHSQSAAALQSQGYPAAQPSTSLRQPTSRQIYGGAAPLTATSAYSTSRDVSMTSQRTGSLMIGQRAPSITSGGVPSLAVPSGRPPLPPAVQPVAAVPATSRTIDLTALIQRAKESSAPPPPPEVTGPPSAGRATGYALPPADILPTGHWTRSAVAAAAASSAAALPPLPRGRYGPPTLLRSQEGISVLLEPGRRSSNRAYEAQAVALAPAPAGPALEGEASGGSEATTVAGLSCEESLSEDEVIAVLAEATVGEDGGVRPRQRRRRPANDRDERPPALNEALLYFRTGLCPPPSIYGDQASPDALDVANEMMAMLQLPDGVRYMPVSKHSEMFAFGTALRFTAFAVCLGSSYFQRLTSRIPNLRLSVKANGYYADYTAYMAETNEQDDLSRCQRKSAPDSSLQAIQFTCINIAAKIVAHSPSSDMHRYMLGKVYDTSISRSAALDVETRCLEGLRWRLGPYFAQDDLDYHLKAVRQRSTR